MPDFDLDDAFDTLTWELSEQTTSPGAGSAIRRARRRRTTIGASAAVALLALGGVVVSQTRGDDHVRPAGPDTTFPEPAPLDAAALDAATSGWVSGWREPTEADSSTLESFGEEIACFGSMSETASPAEPSRSGGGLLVTDERQTGYIVFADFAGQADDAQATQTALGSNLAVCAGEPGTTTSYGDRGVATHYAVPAEGELPAQDVWITVLDDRVGILAIANAEEPPSADVVVAVGRADLAALQSDISYADQGSSGSGSGSASSSSGSSVVYDLVTPGDLDPYFSGWPSWSTTGSADVPQLPCLPEEPGAGFSSSLGGTIGSTAHQSFETFEKATDAAAAHTDLLDELTACVQVRWDVRPLDLAGASDAAIASYDDGAVWVVVSGKALSTLRVTEAGPPSTAIAAGVGQLVLDSLATGRDGD